MFARKLPSALPAAFPAETVEWMEVLHLCSTSAVLANIPTCSWAAVCYSTSPLNTGVHGSGRLEIHLMLHPSHNYQNTCTSTPTLCTPSHPPHPITSHRDDSYTSAVPCQWQYWTRQQHQVHPGWSSHIQWDGRQDGTVLSQHIR